MKKKIKTEQNIIIIMDAIKKIMTIFLGPFLTAYFISTSTNSILNIDDDYARLLGTEGRPINLNWSNYYNKYINEFFGD